MVVYSVCHTTPDTWTNCPDFFSSSNYNSRKKRKGGGGNHKIKKKLKKYKQNEIGFYVIPSVNVNLLLTSATLIWTEA